AALAPALELERAQVRDEVGLPQMVAGADRHEVALAVEVLGFPRALPEAPRVAEDERLVVEHVQDRGQVRRAREARRFLPAAVEDAVARVERDREEAARPP